VLLFEQEVLVETIDAQLLVHSFPLFIGSKEIELETVGQFHQHLCKAFMRKDPKRAKRD